jgi:hypothetical protein
MAQRFGGRAVAAQPTGAENGCKVVRPRPEDHRLGQNLAYRERVRRLHRLGPKPVGLLIAHIVERVPEARDLTLELLDRYAGINPRLLEVAGGRDWLEPTAVLRVVGGRL